MAQTITLEDIAKWRLRVATGIPGPYQELELQEMLTALYRLLDDRDQLLYSLGVKVHECASLKRALEECSQ